MSEYFRKPIVKTLMLKGQEGQSIKGIEKTGTSGLVDTYTITLTDGTTSTFTITNGKDGGLTAGVENKLNREYIKTIPAFEIKDNEDLNDTKFLNIGTYTCPYSSRVPSLSNLPSATPFMMIVLAPLGGVYGQEATTAWTYRMRIFIDYDGVIYLQTVSSTNTAGAFTFGPWKRVCFSSELNALKSYPVGSIFMSINSTSPAELFGGTWEQIKDTFLLACGDTYTAGSTGGEASHTLTVNEIPNHSHEMRPMSDALQGGTTWPGWYYTKTGAGGTIETKQYVGITEPQGGGGAHNNMPPYVAVYVWKRVS